jgi:SAM-dependent methyltransferase
VDGSRSAGELATPDPLDYLRGFDSSPHTPPYKQALFDACALQVEHSLLDVGCGLGSQAQAYAGAVGAKGSAVGIDLSADLIAAAHADASAKGISNVSFQVADVYSISFPAQTFDAVLEDRVLQHLSSPLKAVQEMLRVTKKGGVLVCGNPDWRTFQIDLPSFTADDGGTIFTTANTSSTNNASSTSGVQPSKLLPVEQVDMDQLTRQLLNGCIPQRRRIHTSDWGSSEC